MSKVEFRVAKDDGRTLWDEHAYRTLEGALCSAKTKVTCADVRIHDDARDKVYERAHVVEMLRREPDPAPEVSIG